MSLHPQGGRNGTWERGIWSFSRGKGGEALLQEPWAVPSVLSKRGAGTLSCTQGFGDALRRREKGLCEPRENIYSTCLLPPPSGELLLLLQVQLLAKVQRCTSVKGREGRERGGESRRKEELRCFLASSRTAASQARAAKSPFPFAISDSCRAPER